MPTKILIVDDEPPIIDVLSYNLKRANYEVIVARDGEQALALARQEQPDLMQEMLVAFIFGFGLVSVSLVVTIVGILKEKVWLVILGAAFFAPFAYYLFGASSANVFALIPLFLLLGSAVAVYLRKRLWAWVLAAPALLSFLWVLVVALYYQYQLR